MTCLPSRRSSLLLILETFASLFNILFLWLITYIRFYFRNNLYGCMARNSLLCADVKKLLTHSLTAAASPMVGYITWRPRCKTYGCYRPRRCGWAAAAATTRRPTYH